MTLSVEIYLISLFGRLYTLRIIYHTWSRVDMWNISSSVPLDISRVSAANERDINTRRDIPYLQATRYYDNDVLTIFRRFPITFQRFPKIPLKLLKGHTKVAEHFSISSEAIPEDFRERPEDVRIKNEALEPTGS